MFRKDVRLKTNTRRCNQPGVRRERLKVAKNGKLTEDSIESGLVQEADCHESMDDAVKSLVEFCERGGFSSALGCKCSSHLIPGTPGRTRHMPCTIRLTFTPAADAAYNLAQRTCMDYSQSARRLWRGFVTLLEHTRDDVWKILSKQTDPGKTDCTCGKCSNIPDALGRCLLGSLST